MKKRWRRSKKGLARLMRFARGQLRGHRYPRRIKSGTEPNHIILLITMGEKILDTFSRFSLRSTERTTISRRGGGDRPVCQILTCPISKRRETSRFRGFKTGESREAASARNLPDGLPEEVVGSKTVR